MKHHKRIPLAANKHSKKEKSLASFIVSIRQKKRLNKLSSDQIKLFESLPDWNWNRSRTNNLSGSKTANKK